MSIYLWIYPPPPHLGSTAGWTRCFFIFRKVFIVLSFTLNVFIIFKTPTIYTVIQCSRTDIGSTEIGKKFPLVMYSRDTCSFNISEILNPAPALQWAPGSCILLLKLSHAPTLRTKSHHIHAYIYIYMYVALLGWDKCELGEGLFIIWKYWQANWMSLISSTIIYFTPYSF